MTHTEAARRLGLRATTMEQAIRRGLIAATETDSGWEVSYCEVERVRRGLFAGRLRRSAEPETEAPAGWGVLVPLAIGLAAFVLVLAFLWWFSTKP